MHPKTNVKFDEVTFGRLKKIVRLKSEASHRKKDNHICASPVPEELGIQLTHRCNLRCAHCFQWNEKGFFRDFNKIKQNQDLDISIFSKLLRATKKNRANLYLWGGEPLFHREFNHIAEMLKEDPRWTVLCTNALLIEKWIDALISISSNLALLVSVDGFKEQNDSIRGKGTFEKILQNLDLVLDLQKRKIYKGKVSINCVINDSIIPHLFEFASFWETKGIDSLYFCFPWYISRETACCMDRYYHKYFFDIMLTEDKIPSWYSYTYKIDPLNFEKLKYELKRLQQKWWNIRVRLQPALEIDELFDFIAGKDRTGQRRSQCLAVTNRMDILADGRVSACKIFPELTVGNLWREDVLDIWHNEKFKKIRSVICRELMPVCSKCILLYLNGI